MRNFNKQILLHCSCANETLSTLKFAQRAKFIQNNVKLLFLTLALFETLESKEVNDEVIYD